MTTSRSATYLILTQMYCKLDIFMALFQESIAAAVTEERGKSEEIQKQTKNQIKDELEKYIEMQKKVEHKCTTVK